MNSLKKLYVTGYRSYEMGIFKPKDPKIAIVKKSLKNRLIPYLDNNLEWIVISGQLGVELWAGEVLIELKKIYTQLQYAVIFPYTEFGQKWKEESQQQLQQVCQGADYVNSTSKQPYQGLYQLKNHTQFILQHTEGCVAIYDHEYSGKSQFFIKGAEEEQQKKNYLVDFITIDDLQNETIE